MRLTWNDLRKWMLLITVVMLFIVTIGRLAGRSGEEKEVVAFGDIAASTVDISGPNETIFEFSSDGYWWPGRVIEKWVTVKNTGELPLDLEVFVTGSGRGEIIPMDISFPDFRDIGCDDHDKRHIAPGETEEIKIRAEMLPGIKNAYQNNSWNFVFSFYAKQCVK